MKENCAGEKKNRIGIFGGSFDPVHLGHISLARDALLQCSLDRVLIIPARLQPFKLDRSAASGEDRMNMLNLALEGERSISVSDYELQREGVSYTYLTLRGMRKELGEEFRLYFILGADSLLKLDTWKNSTELLSCYSFIVGSRPGYRDDELKTASEDLFRRYGTEIIHIQNHLLDISATEIRERAAADQPISHLVGDKIERYIREHELYRK